VIGGAKQGRIRDERHGGFVGGDGVLSDQGAGRSGDKRPEEERWEDPEKLR